MQIFTIGVNELTEDGVPKLDGKGQFIPTYGQADIENTGTRIDGLRIPDAARLFIRLEPGSELVRVLHRRHGSRSTSFHDVGAKSLLRGRLTLSPGGGADFEVRAAMRMLVNHPNAPPFISKQLIQKTVTSSPTPAYVARVAAIFKDNGKGTRGDLAAVTRAILLDPEARGARKIDPEYGRLREPVLFWTAMIRALDVTTDGAVPHGQLLRQRPESLQLPLGVQLLPGRFHAERFARPCAGVRDFHVRRVPHPGESSQRPSLQRRHALDARPLWLGAAGLCPERDRHA